MMNTYIISFSTISSEESKKRAWLFLKGISIGIRKSNSTNKFNIFKDENLIIIKTNGRIQMKRILRKMEFMLSLKNYRVSNFLKIL